MPLNDEEKLEKLYRNYWTVHETVMEQGYEAMEVAAVVIAQGLSIYKTILDDEDYEKMVKSIYQSRALVKPIDTI